MNQSGDRNSRRQQRREQRARQERQQQGQFPPQHGQPPQGPGRGQAPNQGRAPQQGQFQGQAPGQGPHGPGYGNQPYQQGPGPQQGGPQRAPQQGGPSQGGPQQGQPTGGPESGYQVRHHGASATTAFSRPPQQYAAPPAQGGPASRSAPETALSAPDVAHSAPEASNAPTVIGTRVASTIGDDPQAFLRVTVIHEDRKGDLLLPGNIPLAEILPSLVRKFTSLTPRGATRGFILLGVDGKPLKPGMSLFDQEVKDGTVLSLASRVTERDKKYDDIVEAVADAAESLNKPWTPANTATTAVAATVVLVLAALFLLISLRPEVGTTVPIMTGVLSVLLLGLSWVLQRMGRSWHAVTIAILSSVAAGATGLTVSLDPLTELPSVFGGLAMVLMAGLALPLLKQWREILAIPMIVGATIAIIGGLYIAFDVAIPNVAVTIAGLIGVAILAVPQLSLRISGLDREREKVDGKEAKKLYTRGHRLMLAFWVSVSILLLIVVLPAVQTGPYGIAVIGLDILLLVMASRRSYAKVDVGIQYSGALLAFVGASAAVMATYPDRWPWVVVALLLVMVATTAFGLVLGRTWTWMRRVADIVELLAIILIIPATVLALKLW